MNSLLIPFFRRYDLFFQRALRLYPHLDSASLTLLVSGGVDSMVLLHTISLYADQRTTPLDRSNLRVLHFNHGVRGEESDRDAVLVAETAGRMGIPYELIKLKGLTGKSNFQARARQARLDKIESISGMFFLLAHHMDDQIENFFVRFIQCDPLFTNFSIRPHQKMASKIFFRPLLKTGKKELQQLAVALKITYREDKSNLETDYLRNRVRLDLLPLLESLTPAFSKKIGRLLKRVHGRPRTCKFSVRPSDSSILREEGKDRDGVTINHLIRHFFPEFRARTGFWDQFTDLDRKGLAQWQVKKDLLIRLYRGRFYLFSPSLCENPTFALCRDSFQIAEASLSQVEHCSSNFAHYPVSWGSPDEIESFSYDSCPRGLFFRGCRRGSMKKLFQTLGIPSHLRLFMPIFVLNQRILGVGSLRQSFNQLAPEERNLEIISLGLHQKSDFPCLLNGGLI